MFKCEFFKLKKANTIYSFINLNTELAKIRNSKTVDPKVSYIDQNLHEI